MRRVLGEALVGPVPLREVSSFYLEAPPEGEGHATVLVTELGPSDEPGLPPRVAIVLVQLSDEDGDAVDMLTELELAPAEAAQLCRALATVAGLEVT